MADFPEKAVLDALREPLAKFALRMGTVIGQRASLNVRFTLLPDNKIELVQMTLAKENRE